MYIYIHLAAFQARSEGTACHKREHEPVHCATRRQGHGARPRRVLADTMALASIHSQVEGGGPGVRPRTEI